MTTKKTTTQTKVNEAAAMVTGYAIRIVARIALALGLVLGLIASAVAETITYAYDPNGNLLTRQSPSQTDNTGYDNLDRLIADQLGTLPIVQYGYDANGNRTSQNFNGFSETSTYAPNSNRLVQRGNQTLTYDQAGNLVDDGQGHTYAYNNAGHLKQAFSSGTLVATYTYNAQGQRTRKVTPQGTTLYHYDINGNLIEETTTAGTPTRDYVYADNMPIAQIDISTTENITYLHTDHLGTPRMGTNSSQTVVWTWRSFAFGSSDANEDPDGDGIKITVNLRIGNSYFDSESSLWQMWHRYYSPALGRFVTSDPIGLAGGENSYVYVANNPLRWIDPTGEECEYKGYDTDLPLWERWKPGACRCVWECGPPCDKKTKYTYGKLFYNRSVPSVGRSVPKFNDCDCHYTPNV